MTYGNFIESIKGLVGEKLGEKYKLAVEPLTKNNGVFLDGLSIRPLGSKVASVIYLNSYYDQVSAGMSVEEASDDIVGMVRRDVFAGSISGLELKDYEKVKPKIMFKVIQAEANGTMLGGVPHILFLDLAIVFYLFLEQNEAGQMTSMIHNSLMEVWQVDTAELWKTASVNTMAAFPAEIKPLGEVVAESARVCLKDIDDEEFMEELFEYSTPPLYVLTNRVGLHGAGCMIYNGVLKAFADSQEDDLVILPSSTHEVLLMPDKLADSYGRLRDMVMAVNQTEVLPEDQLSNQIYKYIREADEIAVVTEDGTEGFAAYPILKNYS